MYQNNDHAIPLMLRSMSNTSLVMEWDSVDELFTGIPLKWEGMEEKGN